MLCQYKTKSASNPCSLVDHRKLWILWNLLNSKLILNYTVSLVVIDQYNKTRKNGPRLLVSLLYYAMFSKSVWEGETINKTYMNRFFPWCTWFMHYWNQSMLSSFKGLIYFKVGFYFWNSLKGCDSNFEVKCSNFESHYKWNNFLALNTVS